MGQVEYWWLEKVDHVLLDSVTCLLSGTHELGSGQSSL